MLELGTTLCSLLKSVIHVRARSLLHLDISVPLVYVALAAWSAYHAAKFGPVASFKFPARWAPDVAAGLAEAHPSTHDDFFRPMA